MIQITLERASALGGDLVLGMRRASADRSRRRCRSRQPRARGATLRSAPPRPAAYERTPGAGVAPLAAATPAGGIYRRHEPEKTVLHGIVREHLETFLDRARGPEGDGYPLFVEHEFRRFLDCGLLCHGFARLRCAEWGYERLVAFSCKGKLCPSCLAGGGPPASGDAARHLPAGPLRLAAPPRAGAGDRGRPDGGGELSAALWRSVCPTVWRRTRRSGASTWTPSGRSARPWPGSRCTRRRVSRLMIGRRWSACSATDGGLRSRVSISRGGRMARWCTSCAAPGRMPGEPRIWSSIRWTSSVVWRRSSRSLAPTACAGMASSPIAVGFGGSCRLRHRRAARRERNRLSRRQPRPQPARSRRRRPAACLLGEPAAPSVIGGRPGVPALFDQRPHRPDGRARVPLRPRGRAEDPHAPRAPQPALGFALAEEDARPADVNDGGDAGPG